MKKVLLIVAIVSFSSLFSSVSAVEFIPNIHMSSKEMSFGAPLLGSASSITASSFQINWSYNAAFTGDFKLYVSENSSFSSHVSGFNGILVSGRSYTVSGLIAGKTYWYRMKTVNTSGDSEYSEMRFTMTESIGELTDWIIAPSEGSVKFISDGFLFLNYDKGVRDPSDLEVGLYRNGSLVSTTSSKKNGYYFFHMSSSFQEGVYEIKISDSSEPRIYDWSGEFYVAESEVATNNVISKSFDENGHVIAMSQSFFDDTGRALQSQSKNITEDKVLVSQPIYDKYGRASGQTLPASSGTSDFMIYKPNFIKTTDGSNYTSENFDKEIPDEVGNQEGTLGYYYSDSNTDEPYQATTAYPFSRTEYYNDGSVEVKSSSMPGETFMTNDNRKSYSKTFPVLNDLDDLYAEIYDDLFTKSGTTFKGRATKTVNINPDGQETIAYSDASGNILVSGYGYISDAAYRVEMPVKYELEAWDYPYNASLLEFYLPARQSPLYYNSFNVEMTGFYELRLESLLTDTEYPTNPSIQTRSLLPGFYRCNCLAISYEHNIYDPAFNFYNDRGQLIASVSPKGVGEILTNDYVDVFDLPFTTYYTYDLKGRLIEMNEPDAGVTKYVYRKDGSIRFSQNAKQADNYGRFSYTNYDRSGRPFESGEYKGGNLIFRSAEMMAILENTDEGGGLITSPNDRVGWVRTYYDLADAEPGFFTGGIEDIIRLNSPLTKDLTITATTSIELEAGFDSNGFNFDGLIDPNAAGTPEIEIQLPGDQHYLFGAVSYTENEHTKTWYSYDSRGLVSWMATWYKDIFDHPKVVKYEYDFLGNVTDVKYQEGEEDAFYHQYIYDADQRLSKVYASAEASPAANSTPHATYEYYLHGPLKKVTLGSGVEDVQYFYTLQGWLKSINNPSDDNSTFAMTLKYFNGDYSRSGVSLPDNTISSQKYNGNIRMAISETTYSGNQVGHTMLYNYDEKGQLKSAQNGTDDAYKVDDLNYDVNGNIQSLGRYNETGSTYLNDLDYHYDTSGTNQLTSVSDAGSENYDVSYTYNEIGEMETMQRQSDALQTFEYDVTGKVVSITNGAAQFDYEYDDRGFRIRKIDHETSSGNEVFVRDASGSIMAVYRQEIDGSFTTLEYSVYGSGRLGTYDAISQNSSYELKDHLGNVRALVTNAGYVENQEDVFLHEFDNTTDFPIGEASLSEGLYHSAPSSIDMGEDFSAGSEVDIPVQMGDLLDVSCWVYETQVGNGSVMVKIRLDDESRVTLATLEPSQKDAWEELSVYDLIMPGDGDVYFDFVNGGSDDFYLDDLGYTITRREETLSVLAANNYYPFGLKMNIGITSDYRYGYQGEFAEEDGETGFNHFELRDYDATTGRWMNVDPYRQHASPYVSMGNNPISRTDPDGGFDEWRLNLGTGETTKIGDKGGDQTQYIYFGADDVPSAVIQGDHFFTGPARIAGTDKWQYTVSKFDLWSSVPNEYLGHYTAFDLVSRYKAFATNSMYMEHILAGESAGNLRKDIWMNSTDYGKYLRSNYGSTSGYMLALDNEMVPLPAGGKIGILKSGSSALSKWHSRVKPVKFNYTPRGKNSTNPWIRHTQNSKGKYGGSNYMNDLKQSYKGN